MELFYFPAPCRERGCDASVARLSPSSLVVELASSPASLSSSSSLFVQCRQLCRPSQSSSLLPSLSSTLSSIAITSVVVVVVVVHRAVAINAVVVVVVVHRSSPPPLPRSDEDGEVVGGPRWLVVVALPEVDDDDDDPISLRASCAIGGCRRMILFIAARLPMLPLPLLFGSRFSANDPRPLPP